LLSNLGLRFACTGKTTDNSYFSKVLRNKSSAVAEMGNRLPTIDMGKNWGGVLWGLGPHWVTKTVVVVVVVSAVIFSLFYFSS